MAKSQISRVRRDNLVGKAGVRHVAHSKPPRLLDIEGTGSPGFSTSRQKCFNAFWGIAGVFVFASCLPPSLRVFTSRGLLA
jgi:hypothetical protein